MKRKIVACIVVTLVLVSALAAGALAASSGGLQISGPSSVSEGETITLRIDGGNVEGATADITVSGLEIVSFSGGLSDESSILLLNDYGGMTANYTYRVVAADGQTVSFTLSNVIVSENMVDSNLPNSQWTAVVGGGAASSSPSDEPSQTPTNPPSEEPSTSPSTNPTDQPSDQPSQEPSTSASTNPSVQPSDQQTQAPAPTTSGSTPTTAPSNGGAAVVTTAPSSGGGTTGGTTTGTTVVRLPKTADSTTNMWIFACLTAAVGTIAIIAARKCAIGKDKAHDEQ